MRPDSVPGGVFPDYELPDQTGTLRKLSELQGDDPLILFGVVTKPIFIFTPSADWRCSLKKGDELLVCDIEANEDVKFAFDVALRQPGIV